MKKIISCIVSLVMLLTLNIGTAFADIDYSARKPVLNIVNEDMPVVKAGEKLILNLKFESVNKYAAKNVDVTIKNEGPFEVENMTSTKRIDRIGPYVKEAVQFKVHIKGDAEGKIYPMLVSYRYQNEYGVVYDDEKTIYIKVLSGLSPASLGIDNVKTDIKEISAGDKFKLTFDVENKGTLLAKNIKVSLEDLDSDNGFTIVNGINSKDIEYIMPNSSKKGIEFNLYAASDMKSGNHKIKVRFKYKDSENNDRTDEYEFYLMVNGTDSDKKANISIDNVKVPTGDIIPGNDFVISFDLKNKGVVSADNVIISVSDENKNIPTVQKVISSVGVDNTNKVLMNVHVPKNVPAQYYILSITAKCDNNKVDLVKQYANIKVGKLSDISISNVSVSKKLISENDTFEVKFDVKNSGLGTAENLVTTVDGTEGLIPLNENVINISALKSGETKHFSISMQATDSIKIKNIPIMITVNNPNGSIAAKRFTTVYFEGKATGKTVPKIIIKKFECTPNIVKAGENFGLYLSFLNTNKVKTVRNIKIFLTVDMESSKVDSVGSGSVFTPVNGSNTFYIDEIRPKKTQSISLKMYTIPDAQPKNYTITANMEYEDEEGNQFTSKELIGIQVTQPSKLKIGDISLPSDAFKDRPNPVDIQVYNVGKVTMSNFMIEIKGDFTARSDDSFIGNIEPGSAGYYSGDLIPKKLGECKGEIIFSYDEPSGEHKVVKKSISMNAQKYVPRERHMNGMDKPEQPVEQPKSSKKSKVVLILGGILAVVVIGVVIKKKRNKRKGLDLDE
ncbi:hypothetical protein CLTEP_16070 [Clostridium tepidiprofundi DSM 19306]|uniref:CARDB domain-containing protein n=1 Tax=Clostridium tepidiprofundi DSM 19306 TaxID=1121338 RepID=A0A151B3G8_9CLOT|nr:hypothetical protein [Clostridium tepidiprofundi]KYH34455.1 hypothetical protein CLTEP_16070 [Clostridium tepidiprofundi DSM 19306]